ncbi:glutamate racemase [Aerococcus sp. Group 1]|uniref:glutamate racemase n=1 Tax=Aerococcus urinae (strain CCUG 59500 / ACS-120-V-Col10a) TaxID=2976812 RepID=UPI000200EA92|nr:glutamate racemase [Aerococcus sp. Group 1]AEA00578.1 glutamate racemase [Aerococcus sp. Group 1]MCY3031534.1 glutamate racemase [Aerococcus sp. Group 1]MCY3055679.1 glutamate racemase [Aerococcus sp. Group 1]MCY3057409.1 glutamate racemase [Aerococcus sp. Group 1]MCY3062641.1 glutamate racemase [Aerococcus sp. Group 1]
MKRPIGFLDSGVGGLTVVKEAMRQLPNESIIYIGDNARCPYGPRPEAEINEFTQELVDFLLEQNIKMLVIACNTATAVSLERIRQRVNIPVIGVIHPGARAANRYSENGHIGILATEATINSHFYQNVLLDHNKHLILYPLVCSKFVPLVESGQYSSPIAKKIVAESLYDLKQTAIDTLILGCTHYPLLAPLIQKFMGPGVRLVNSGAETVSDVSAILDLYNLAESSWNPEAATYQFYTTGGVTMFKDIAKTWLQKDIPVSRIPLSQLEAKKE